MVQLELIVHKPTFDGACKLDVYFTKIVVAKTDRFQAVQPIMYDPAKSKHRCIIDP